MKKVSKQLFQYIKSHILPEYEKNDKGHNLEHIKAVTKRSFKFAKGLKDIDYDILYTVASFHDVGHSIDPKNHETVSANILRNDETIKTFFRDNEIQIMAEAIEDHRASSKNEPRNIYGKIVSTADRNADIKIPLQRTYEYNLKNNPNISIEENINEAYNHLKDKYGKNGYAIEKFYFEDKKFEKFKTQMEELTSNKKKFRNLFLKANKLKF